MSPRATLLGAAALILGACGAPDAEVQPSGADQPAAVTPGNFPLRSFERNFVFMTTTADSALIVPWLLETTTTSDRERREARGWLSRSGVWEAFFSARWETPLTRVPARPLPYGSLRLVVREGDVVDGILYEEGERDLEIGMGDTRAEWAGPRGESFQLLAASLYLSDRRVGGLVLDMARGSSPESPRAGDWAFLVSGDSLQLVLEGTAQHDADSYPPYLAWGTVDFRDLQWSVVEVEWAETSAFQPARRDVPTRWTLDTPDGSLTGRLEVVSASITPGEGTGPILPLTALFEVGGTLVVEERPFPVRGLLVHERR